ncbi:MAG: hypothetical protein Q4G22_08105 [Paracoccus sp. (in: a-proteobacteria)]|uniref:hypothetical protein n=1 Tax=Paracoccus sp. TaxID=267 RepID=UPI0026DFC93A|nr:hypothetical protein [Paracoccus sp. (in: a-proteobacteria)]MDO5631786.1 hypothetical protein [Paracoccus sp. (in: a-proteobacteria)]
MIRARRNLAPDTAILDAAIQIIAGQSDASLAAEPLARRARAGKVALYCGWPSRERLMLALSARAKSALPEPGSGDMTRHVTDMIRHLNGNDRQEPLVPLLRWITAPLPDATVRQVCKQQRQESR